MRNLHVRARTHRAYQCLVPLCLPRVIPNKTCVFLGGGAKQNGTRSTSADNDSAKASPAPNCLFSVSLELPQSRSLAVSQLLSLSIQSAVHSVSVSVSISVSVERHACCRAVASGMWKRSWAKSSIRFFCHVRFVFSFISCAFDTICSELVVVILLLILIDSVCVTKMTRQGVTEIGIYNFRRRLFSIWQNRRKSRLDWLCVCGERWKSATLSKRRKLQPQP